MIRVEIGPALLTVVCTRGLRFHSDRSFYPTLVIVIACNYSLFAVMAGQETLKQVAVAGVFIAINVAVAGGTIAFTSTKKSALIFERKRQTKPLPLEVFLPMENRGRKVLMWRLR